MKLLSTARLLVVSATLALSALGSFAHAAATTDPVTGSTGGAPLDTASITAQSDYWAVAEPGARAVKAEYNIPASVAAAQAALESGYGASSLAAPDAAEGQAGAGRATSAACLTGRPGIEAPPESPPAGWRRAGAPQPRTPGE